MTTTRFLYLYKNIRNRNTRSLVRLFATVNYIFFLLATINIRRITPALVVISQDFFILKFGSRIPYFSWNFFFIEGETYSWYKYIHMTYLYWIFFNITWIVTHTHIELKKQRFSQKKSLYLLGFFDWDRRFRKFLYNQKIPVYLEFLTLFKQI